MPARWWPLGRQTPVVIDPARSFPSRLSARQASRQPFSPMRSRPRFLSRKSRGCSSCRRGRSRRPCGSRGGRPTGLRLEGLYRQQSLPLPRPRAPPTPRIEHGSTCSRPTAGGSSSPPTGEVRGAFHVAGDPRSAAGLPRRPACESCAYSRRLPSSEGGTPWFGAIARRKRLSVCFWTFPGVS